ncbi:MAG: hypothetical protein AB1921_02320 [Thermodesulfobacteriota bacterium]
MERVGQGGGLAAGTYEAARPVAEILRDAVAQALAQAGFEQGREGSGAELCARVEELGFGVMVGFARCLLKCNIKADFRLTYPGNGSAAWSAVLSATGTAATGDLISLALTGAIGELASALVRDPGFTKTALAARV